MKIKKNSKVQVRLKRNVVLVDKYLGEDDRYVFLSHFGNIEKKDIDSIELF